MESANVIPSLVPYLEYCSAMCRLGQVTGVGLPATTKEKVAPSSRSLIPGQQRSPEQEQLVKEVQNLVVLSMFYLTRLRYVFILCFYVKVFTVYFSAVLDRSNQQYAVLFLI